MFRFVWLTIASLSLMLLGGAADSLGAQADNTGFKSFTRFSVMPGVDFFASSRQDILAFQEPIAETRERLASLLGTELPRGAIFVCSTLAQKDEVYEPRAAKMGYKWTLTVLTPQARSEEIRARMKAQMGADIPAERLQRFQSRSREMQGRFEAGLARAAARQMAYALLQVTQAPEKEFRFSRVDDMGRSPLPDWLDIGIAAYAVGDSGNVRFLEEHLDETFPLEDLLTMARPFVAPGTDMGSAPVMVFRRQVPGGTDGPSGEQAAGVPAGDQTSGAQPARPLGGQFNLPKDQLDRMLFDNQAASIFAYLVEKAGIDKVKQLIALAGKGEDGFEFITGPDVMGPDLDKVEQEWVAWVKTRRPEGGPEFPRRTDRQGRPGRSRQ
ncbi:MAG TPA: hypothetical protein PLP42_05775 [Acidobacteriota bacterium]|nr:hypothetical protein [Acidobacteriota bacterium]